jgi:hypothetical protein
MTAVSELFTNEVTEALDALVTSPFLSDDDVVEALAAVSRKIIEANHDLTAPITNAQRGAMFGAFTRVFGSQNREARRIFTRLALGRAADAPVSWADFGNGTLTFREAHRVLNALASLETALA